MKRISINFFGVAQSSQGKVFSKIPSVVSSPGALQLDSKRVGLETKSTRNMLHLCRLYVNGASCNVLAGWVIGCSDTYEEGLGRADLFLKGGHNSENYLARQ